MEDDRLIEMVRKYEFLYNLKHPKYMDNIRKDKAWKEIGEQLRQSALACKQRWQCLRDSYRRALNKKKRKGLLAAKYMKRWKYEDEMAFVAPFFLERKPQDSVEMTSDDALSDNADDNLATECNASQNRNTDIEFDGAPVEVSDSTRLSDDVPHSSNESQTNYTVTPKAVKRKAVDSEPSASAIFLAKLLEDQDKIEPARRLDELDRFFLNISDTVKKFPPYVQALAKKMIFSLVSEMEIQQLTPPGSAPPVFNLSSQSTIVKTMPPSPDN